MIKDKVLQTIKENKLIKKRDKIILGISGGPDSIFLLNILYSLKKELDLKIILAHVNYKFRGQCSDDDEKFIKKIAQRLKLELYIRKINPKIYQNNNVGNLEEYFRQIRYKFFNKILLQEKANSIAVAHQKDDQVETFLMFLLRGSGIFGLSGIKIKRDKIIRPLLNVSKKEILEYLKQNKILYQQDKTNQNTDYTRNKIRHKLIPYLEKKFNPNLKNTLSENIKVIQDEENLLQQISSNTFNNLVSKNKKGFVIDLKSFKNLHLALQKRILLLLIKEFKEKPSLFLVEDILKMIKNSKTGSKKYLKQIEFLKNYDKIVVRKKYQEKKIKLVALKINRETKIKGLNIRVKITKIDKVGKIGQNRCYIDSDKTGNKLFIRVKKDGDRFYPKGMLGSQKLKNFFINNKIIREKRDKITLIVTEKDEIVWVVRYRLDRRFEVTKNSKNILKIKISK